MNGETEKYLTLEKLNMFRSIFILIRLDIVPSHALVSRIIFNLLRFPQWQNTIIHMISLIRSSWEFGKIKSNVNIPQ